MLWICVEISSVACAVWLASALTSLATTANPRPCSPARAASIVALRASRFVWLAMFWISVNTSPILWVPAARPSTTVLVRRGASAAFSLTFAERRACWALSLLAGLGGSCLFGLLVGLCAVGVGASFGSGRSFGLGGLLRGCLEQARQLMSDPDQHASLHDENARV